MSQATWYEASMLFINNENNFKGYKKTYDEMAYTQLYILIFTKSC